MNENFKLAFSNLSLNDKRNQISEELIIISELIKAQEQNIGLPTILNVKNYNSHLDRKLSESQMLDFIYEDIYSIERELITLFKSINTK